MGYSPLTRREGMHASRRRNAGAVEAGHNDDGAPARAPLPAGPNDRPLRLNLCV